MKKVFFLAACAAALFTSCSQEEVSGVEIATDQAINFSAYTQTANAARGTVVDAAGVDKIGVFAFYQPAATGDFTTYKYATPDFMYNQEVSKPGSGTNWTYSPLKYWPNNAGDKLSFFAYAPYSAAKTWEDLGVKTDVNGTKMTLNFPIYPEVQDQQDYLFAAPQLNLEKQAVSENVAFTFDHITSQVNLYVGVEVDEETAPSTTNTPMKWTDENTTIQIQSIEFTDLSSSIVYTIPATGTATHSVGGSKQNIVMSGADFVTTAATINKDNYASVTGYTKLNTDDAVMFLAPEVMSRAIMTYTVTTTDTKLPGGKSVITNVAEANLSALTLAAGKVYNLKFLIGMTSVKLTASVNAWDGTATDEVIVLPVANK